MNGQRLFELLSDLPDDLIAGAEAARPVRRRKPSVLQWTALAACATFAIFLGALTLGGLGGSKSESAPADAAAPSESAAEDTATAETAPESPAPPAMEPSPSDSAGSTDGGFGDAAQPQEPAADVAVPPAPPGFWNGYSLTSDAITLYTPGADGWTAAATVTDDVSIKGIYVRLFISDPEVLPNLTETDPFVLVDLQNGFAFTLYEGDRSEATLYTVPDEAALTDALQNGEDPWQYLHKTDHSVLYTTDLDAFVAALFPQ